MPEIARLDENGMIISVEFCTEDEYRTDPIARTVQLDAAHDMRNRIRSYRWDFNRHAFMPLSTEPLDIAERDTSELVDGLVEAVEDIYNHLSSDSPGKFRLSARTRKVISEFRRTLPRKRQLSRDSEAVIVKLDARVKVVQPNIGVIQVGADVSVELG